MKPADGVQIPHLPSEIFAPQTKIKVKEDPTETNETRRPIQSAWKETHARFPHTRISRRSPPPPTSPSAIDIQYPLPPHPQQTFTTSINGSNLEIQIEKRADEEILHRERERERRRRALVSIAGNREETSREETAD